MFFFDFESTPDNYEYYEILQTLMARWEHEIVEFKEAKGQYSEDKIGQYFSAISNEANPCRTAIWLVHSRSKRARR